MGANMNMSRVIPFSAVSLLLLAIGCGSSSSPATPGASNIYVVQNNASTGASSVLQFPSNAQGSLMPTATLTAPENTTFYSVAIDTSSNLYVSAGDSTSFEVLVYAPIASGIATPVRSITNFSSYVVSLAVDSTGEIYAITGDTISVFAANATGNAVPVRQIVGTATQSTTHILSPSMQRRTFTSPTQMRKVFWSSLQ